MLDYLIKQDDQMSQSMPECENINRDGEDESCLLYTSDAADDMQCVDLGGRRII